MILPGPFRILFLLIGFCFSTALLAGDLVQVSGRIRDVAGTAVSGAELQLLSAQHGVLGGARTDSEGRFDFPARHLLCHIPGNVLVIWDSLRSHRGRLVKAVVAEQQGRLTLEFLPAYAPELNPVEYLWGYWKQHELPNLCPKTFGELSHFARRALRRMPRRPTLVTAFWRQAELFE